MDFDWTKIALSLIGVIVGFTLNEFRHWLRESRKSKQERRTLASSLAVEICNLATQCFEHGNKLNNRHGTVTYSPSQDVSGKISVYDAIRQRPRPFTIYNAVVGKVSTLGPEAATAVISFYQSLENIREFIWRIERRYVGTAGSLDENETGELEHRWRTSCATALEAIRLIGPLAESTAMRSDYSLSSLKEFLQIVADEGVVPR